MSFDEAQAAARKPVDPAQLVRLRQVPGCGVMGHERRRHFWAHIWSNECDACLTLFAAAVEEQTIERCAEAFVRDGSVLADDFEVVRWAERVVRSLPRQWNEK